jgi:hypothetical protein
MKIDPYRTLGFLAMTLSAAIVLGGLLLLCWAVAPYVASGR